MPARRRRWLRRASTALAVGAALALLTLVVLVRSLDRPWLKRRLQALVQQKSGLEVDWTATQVALFSGLRVERLTVLTPPALRAAAPELVRVEGLELSWTARSLVAGAPRLGALRVESLALTLVRDAAGRTSLSTIEPKGRAAPASPVPPSRAAAEVLAGGPPIGRIDVARLILTVLAQAANGPREQLRVDGLALHATLTPAGRGFAVSATLGSAAAPLSVAVRRSRAGVAAGEARARLWAELTASPTAAAARLDLEVERQTLAPATPIAEAAHLEASARFGDGAVRIAVTRTRLADGAATVDGEVELRDGAPPRIERADGEVDLPHLLTLVPASLVPIAAERARLRYHIAGGSGTVEGELGRVRVAQAHGALVADGGRVRASVRQEHGVPVVHAVAPLASLSMPGVAAEKLQATVDARIAADGAISGDAALRFGALRLQDAGGARHGGAPAATRVMAADGEIGVHAEELRVDRALPLATRGLVILAVRAASVEAAHAGTHAIADGVAASARAQLRGEPPYAIDAELPIVRLRLAAAGRSLVDGAAHLAVHASEVRPDAARPLRCRARLHGELTLGALALALDADKAPDAVDFKLRADAASLALLRPLWPGDATGRVPWEQMSLALASAGRLERFAAPSLREHTTLAVAHGAWASAGGRVAADRVEVDSTSSGTLQQHEAALEVRTRALALDGAPQGDAAVSLRASWDGRAQRSRLHLATVGDQGPLVALDAAVGFDRARRALTYDVDGKLARLATLAPLVHGGLANLDVAALAVEVKGTGALTGLVHDVDAGGGVHLVAAPLRTLAADGTLDLAVSGFDWSRGDREIIAPHARWHAILATDGPRRLLHGTLRVDALTIDLGDHALVLHGLRDDIDGAIAGDLRAGVGELDHRLAIDKVTQDLAAHYRVGDVTLELKAGRDADGVVHIDELALSNRAGGTTLSLRGAVDAGAERRSLSLAGELSQDLSRLWSAPGQMQGQGRASVQLRVDSGNLRVYHTRAAVRVAGATVKLPGAGVTMESMDGEIPLTSDVVIDDGGARLVRATSSNSYSELRFADQHPLLSRQSFISAARVTTPWATLAPIAGNLRVDGNLVSLHQLELGMRGGRVTGLCILDWHDGGATVQLRVRASDVRSSHGEPFDGNAAVIVSTRERSVEGRAEILRIGKRHLYDLLDLEDPHHADAAVNRVRRALSLGYPDHLRLSFNHGFADVKIAFGGLARLVRVDDLHGIPMGPLIDKLLAPLERKQEDDQ